MAAANNYEFYPNQYSDIYPDTKAATDHSQILIMRSEWEDIKKSSSQIKLIKPSINYRSLLFGAILSTLIPFAYSLFSYFTSKSKNLNDIIFYLLFITILSVICALTQSKDRQDEQRVCNGVHHDYLSKKIEEIDKRFRDVF